MSRLNMVIGDLDEAYLDSLVSFLIRNYSHRLQISSFTRRESLEKHLLEAGAKIDILLIGSCLYSEGICMDKTDCLLLLSEDHMDNTSVGMPVVYKYQQGDKLVRDILDIYSEKNSGKTISEDKNKKSRVVSVFSPQGGSGKTCIAVSSCIQIARSGMKVFYLNLEDFNSTASFFDCSSEAGLSKIIYYLKEKSKNLMLKIEATKSIDPFWGIHYFAPPESDTELHELSVDDVRELISQLKLLGTYDLILLDMSSSFGPMNMEILKFCDEIVLTMVRVQSSKVKFERLFRDFIQFIQKDSGEFKTKLKLVMNRCRQDDGIIGLEGCFSGIELVRVPEIRDFDWDKIMHVAKMDGNFTGAVDKLVQKYKTNLCSV